MTFLWPPMLVALLFIPVIVAAYVRLQRRQRALAASFYGLADGQPSGRPYPGVRRHIPPLLFLLGLASLLLALARPQAAIVLPRVEGTVILVLDVSGSMAAADAEPTRLEAAKTAAREFVLGRPKTIQIGIVSFSGSGFTVQSPTDDVNALLNTINRLQPTTGTSLGQGILSALHTLAVHANLVKAPSTAKGSTDNQPSGPEAQPAERPQDDLLAQLPLGAYPAAVIVLLSDGENNQSLDPLEAAEAAAERGVRIDALGFGTTAGAVLNLDGFSVHTALDEGTLRQITEAAGGAYYPAQGEQDRKHVFANLTPRLAAKRQVMEVTSVFAGASILLLLAGSLISMAWFNRLP